MDNLHKLRRIIAGIGHNDQTAPETAPEIVEVEIKASEMAIASIRTDLHEIGRLAAMGELSDWETEALGDIAEKAVEAWRAAVAAMVGRLIAG